MSFKNFHNQFNYLTIEETIEFYSIFDGHPFLKYIKLDHDIFTCIKEEIIEHIDDLKPYFVYDENEEFQQGLESILHRLAIGDRKSYTIYKKENISQIRGRMLFKSLFEKQIIRRERSREKPKREFKGQLIKKSLRNYDVQDKIHFTNNFTRFWFTFIHPYIINGDTDKEKLLLHVKNSIEQFVSLTFEELSIELIKKKIGQENIKASGSYWDKDIEIDLLIETKFNIIVAGESKWKNHRVSKKILNALEKKCQRAYFEVDKYVLFSKSGFSKELDSLKEEKISLYTLNDFKVLYD